MKTTHQTKVPRHKRRNEIASVGAFIKYSASLLFASAIFAQQTATPSSFDVQARRRDMLAHLRSVIQFRRAIISNVQKPGDPNDAVYREQADLLSSQTFADAFDWARAEAHVLESFAANDGASAHATANGELAKLLLFQRDLNGRINTLQLQIAALDDQNASADTDRKRQRQNLKLSIDFLTSMRDAAQHIGETSESSNGVGLLADVYSLQQSVPELQGSVKVRPKLIDTDRTASSGVISQAQLLLELLGTKNSLKAVIADNDRVRKEADQLRKPVTTEALRLMQLSNPGTLAGEVVPPADVAKMKSLAADAVPLSQEIIVSERSRNNLAAWQTSINNEYFLVFSALVTRVALMAAALVLVFVGSEVSLRVSHRYIRDPRRRRQFLNVRRLIVGVLSTFVLVVGFVSNFSSLATFAGFLTAGLAVGLQTILLSVAAYFFIVGRYGIKVGDRITVASVTGEVIDVGLFRFYIMELAGFGSDMKQTGRVAVFSNAVLFQANTPLYKQIPGSQYSWRELTANLSEDADHQLTRIAVVDAINTIFDTYKSNLEHQLQTIQSWLHTGIDSPAVESRVTLTNGQFQLWVRFPVIISQGSETDEKVTRALCNLIALRSEIKSALKSVPVLQPSVKG